jgi:hypothetical protein
MRYSFITPTKYINHEWIWTESDFILALSHLIDVKTEPNDYTREIIKSSKPIYLDNWVFENWKPEWVNVLIDKLLYLQSLWKKPEVVFLPDELFNAEKTYGNLIEWNKVYSERVRDKCKTQSCLVLQW